MPKGALLEYCITYPLRWEVMSGAHVWSYTTVNKPIWISVAAPVLAQ
jgi:hypothetical protein